MKTDNKKCNIIVDFFLENDFLFIRFFNHSDLEALYTSVKLSPRIIGKGGKVISDISIFRELKYMAPRKEYLIYVDHMDAFLENHKRGIFRINISFTTSEGRKIRKKIVHNLNVYKDLPIIYKRK